MDTGDAEAELTIEEPKIPAMAPKTCMVTLTDVRGSRHSVEVLAESPFDAPALGMNRSGKMVGSTSPAPQPVWTFRSRRRQSSTK